MDSRAAVLILEILSAAMGLVSLIGGSIAVYVSLSLKAALSAQEVKHAERHIKTLEEAGKQREADRQEREATRAEWFKYLNGSFMRALVVEKMFQNYDQRLTATERLLEKRIEA